MLQPCSPQNISVSCGDDTNRYWVLLADQSCGSYVPRTLPWDRPFKYADARSTFDQHQIPKQRSPKCFNGGSLCTTSHSPYQGQQLPYKWQVLGTEWEFHLLKGALSEVLSALDTSFQTGCVQWTSLTPREAGDMQDQNKKESITHRGM